MSAPVTTVVIDPRALRAHGLSPGDLAAAFVGTILVMVDGSTWRVNEAGGFDPVIQGAAPGGRSVASDPAAQPRGDA